MLAATVREMSERASSQRASPAPMVIEQRERIWPRERAGLAAYRMLLGSLNQDRSHGLDTEKKVERAEGAPGVFTEY